MLSWIDMSFHSDTLSIVSALIPECCVISGEAAHTNVIDFDLTRGRTHYLPDHADHNTTDSVLLQEMNIMRTKQQNTNQFQSYF